MGSWAADSTGNNLYCNGNSSTVTYPAYWFSSTTSGCNSSTAGLSQFTGTSVSPNSTFEFCNGTSWQVLGTATSLALSSLTAATGSNTITGNANYAQTWSWGTLGGNTALALTSTDMTSGTILEIENTYGGNSTGYMVYLEDVTTGTGSALYVLTSGANNTGYAGYFVNTATSGANYGLYATASSASGYGGYFNNSGAGWALGVTGTSYFNGNVGIGTATPSTALSLYTTTTGGLWFTMNDAASGGGEWQMVIADNGNSAEAGSLNFVYNGNASSQGALSLTTSDWVGISNNGWASVPISMFDVAGSGDTRITVQSSDTTSGNYTGYQLIAGEGTTTFEGGIMIPNNNKSLVELWSQVDTLNLTSTGSVGIGQTAPGTSLDVNGGLTTEPETVNVTGNNQLITVGNNSFIQLSSNSTSGYVVCLSAGTAGQMLVLEDVADNVELENNATPCSGGAANVHMASNWNATANDTLRLIYDGADSYWVGVARTVGNNTYVDSTSQTANISSTQLATSSPIAGNFYKITCFVIVTTAATTSSTMPSCAYTYTDEASSTHTAIPITATSNANAAGTSSLGTAIFFAKANTALDYATTGYASSGGTAMSYSLHLRLEQLW